jgi:hypothetical protein
MNNNLIEIFIQYLKIETNYAVIINGNYGVGKTHFFKNELSPKINTATYIPIHISLFGIRKLEEIQTAIFLELYPILKDKKLKLAAGIVKSIIRGIAQVHKSGDIDKYIEDLSPNINEWLSYDELVICFDDVDRKSSSLDISDFLGFVNSLVENQGAKILIITNEKESLKDLNYLKLREKVIGVSIDYSPNTNVVYNQIIKQRYEKSSSIYFTFLKSNSVEIISVIEKNEDNFRNLIFFLEHFRIIFCAIEMKFEEDPNFVILKDNKQKSILDFSLAISFEYKLGLLNSNTKNQIKEINKTISFNIEVFKILSKSNENKNIDTQETTYINTFTEKYYSENQYYFFNSIFEYITGSNAFDVVDLKSELENHFIVKNGIVSKQDKLLSQLAHFESLKLSNFEYRNLTRQLLQYIDKGDYQLHQFSTAFYYAVRFNNLMCFDIEKLKIRFKKGIAKGVKKYKYESNLDFYITTGNEPAFKKDEQEIINYCLQINETLSENNELHRHKEYFKLFLTDYAAFNEKAREQNGYIKHVPFWIKVDINKVYRRILKLNNDEIWKFGHYINDRYRRNIYEGLFPEKEFLTNLRSMIDYNSKKRKTKNLQNASLDYLSTCLINSEANFI